MTPCWRLRHLAMIAAIAVSIACGSSPTAPSVPDDIVLDGFAVDAQPIFAGLGPTYTLFGSIRVAAGVTDQVTVQQMTVDILDQNSRPFLTFSGVGFPNTVGPNAVLSGAFATTSDRDSTRAPGVTFVAHVTYSRAGASARTAETRGPIVSRRPPV
jgi:hypothetical protein